jgi:hypothetical protein
MLLAVVLVGALYVSGYFLTDIAPYYGVSEDYGKTRMYRWQIEALLYIPAGKLESLARGRRVNVASADNYVFHLH